MVIHTGDSVVPAVAFVTIGTVAYGAHRAMARYAATSPSPKVQGRRRVGPVVCKLQFAGSSKIKGDLISIVRARHTTMCRSCQALHLCRACHKDSWQT